MTKQNGRTPLLIEEEEMTEVRNRLVDNARRVALVGLGLFDYGQSKLGAWQEESGKWFDELVERGQKVEEESRQRFEDLSEKRQERTKKVTNRAESEIDQRLEQLAVQLNLPQQDDIEKLNKKVNSLNRKLDELKKMQAA